MIARERRARPAPWRQQMDSAASWSRPFIAIEWVSEWGAFLLSNWTFLEVLEYLGSFSVLVAGFGEVEDNGDRVKQRHYQAWQVINTAQGKGGSGGRIEALQELNEDKVLLVGVDVSSAFLQGIRLHRADLLRANFSAADLRSSDLSNCNFTLANLSSANFRGAILDRSRFSEANLRNADLNGASLIDADLSGAILDDADLRSADLANVQWRNIKSAARTNIAGVRNASPGFVDWALKNGAVSQPDADN
jgi:hypothetical protein